MMDFSAFDRGWVCTKTLSFSLKFMSLLRLSFFFFLMMWRIQVFWKNLDHPAVQSSFRQGCQEQVLEVAAMNTRFSSAGENPVDIWTGQKTTPGLSSGISLSLPQWSAQETSPPPPKRGDSALKKKCSIKFSYNQYAPPGTLSSSSWFGDVIHLQRLISCLIITQHGTWVNWKVFGSIPGSSSLWLVVPH